MNNYGRRKHVQGDVERQQLLASTARQRAGKGALGETLQVGGGGRPIREEFPVVIVGEIADRIRKVFPDPTVSRTRGVQLPRKQWGRQLK